jgi:hypothetical protein
MENAFAASSQGYFWNGYNFFAIWNEGNKKMTYSKENGISVITCSVKPELCNEMLKSVENTIGTNYETIIFDNREKKMGICQVYNLCAQKANFPYLCFIHEDVIISTPNWGMNMLAFSEKTPNCGTIGFAGGTIAMKNFISWWCGTKGRYRYYDSDSAGKTNNIANLSYKYNNPDNEEFAKAVTLDGLFLFVKRKIWEKNPFDEERIKGFHFYDADFSFGIAQKFQNYVCLTVDIYHFAGGNIDRTYYENARIFQKKWKGKLPCSIAKQKIDMIDEIKSASNLFYNTYKLGIKNSIRHFIEINGLFYFLVFCVLMTAKRVKKKISPLNGFRKMLN